MLALKKNFFKKEMSRDEREPLKVCHHFDLRSYGVLMLVKMVNVDPKYLNPVESQTHFKKSRPSLEKDGKNVAT